MPSFSGSAFTFFVVFFSSFFTHGSDRALSVLSCFFFFLLVYYCNGYPGAAFLFETFSLHSSTQEYEALFGRVQEYNLAMAPCFRSFHSAALRDR